MFFHLLTFQIHRSTPFTHTLQFRRDRTVQHTAAKHFAQRFDIPRPYTPRHARIENVVSDNTAKTRLCYIFRFSGAGSFTPVVPEMRSRRGRAKFIQL